MRLTENLAVGTSDSMISFQLSSVCAKVKRNTRTQDEFKGFPATHFDSTQHTIQENSYTEKPVLIFYLSHKSHFHAWLVSVQEGKKKHQHLRRRDITSSQHRLHLISQSQETELYNKTNRELVLIHKIYSHHWYVYPTRKGVAPGHRTRSGVSVHLIQLNFS